MNDKIGNTFSDIYAFYYKPKIRNYHPIHD